jgi:hypothetical protein
MPTRRPGAILAATLIVLPLVLAAALAVAPGWAERAGLDWWHLPALERDRRAAADRVQELDAEREATARRMALKEAVVAELVAGRVSLAEVTALFAAMDRDRPGYADGLRASFPDCPEREVVLRNTIGYALTRVTDPTERERLAARLEAELREVLARPGEPSDGTAPGAVRVE